MELGALSPRGTEAFAFNDLLCHVQSVTMSGTLPGLAFGATVLTPRWLGKLIGDVLGQVSVAQHWAESRINESSEEHSSLPCLGV